MKFNELPKTGSSGRPLEVKNAMITSVSIDIERCLTAWLFTESQGGSCGFGGIMLGNRDGPNIQPRGKINYCAAFLTRCMAVGGSETWEGLKGRPIRVLTEGLGGVIVAVGHYMKDEWFCPMVEFKDDN